MGRGGRKTTLWSEQNEFFDKKKVVSWLQTNLTRWFKGSLAQNTAVQVKYSNRVLWRGFWSCCEYKMRKTCRNGSLRGITPTLMLISRVAPAISSYSKIAASRPINAWAARDHKHVCYVTRSKNHKKRQTLSFFGFWPGGKTDMLIITSSPGIKINVSSFMLTSLSLKLSWSLEFAQGLTTQAWYYSRVVLWMDWSLVTLNITDNI